MGRVGAQVRVLHALMIREMITRYGRSRLGYLWAVVEPAGFIALLAVLFTQIADAPALGRSFVLFYASGYLAYHWVIDIAGITGRAVHVNRPLLAFPAVTPLDTVLARFFLQALTGLVVAALILGGALWVFEEPVRLSPGPLLGAFATAAVLALGIGTLNAWAFAVSRTWEIAWGVLTRPLFLVSCVFYTYASMPGFVREVLWYNPLIHIVGLLRAGIYPVYDASHVAPAYPLAIGLAALVAGILGIRAANARLVLS